MNKIKSSPLLGSLLVMFAACLWGCTGLFVGRIGGAGLTSMEIVVCRGILAAVVLAPIMLAIDPALFRIKWKHLWCFIGTGLLSMLFFNYCYYSNIQETSPAVAVVLLFTSPVFATLMARVFFKEKITWNKVVALVLILIGCALVTGLMGESDTITRRGLILGLCSGFGYALYLIFSRAALNRGYSPVTVTFYTFLLSAVGGVFLVDLSHLTDTALTGGAALWWPLMAYVLIGTVGAYCMYTAGLRHIDTSKAALLKALEPASTTVLQILVLGIWPDTWGLIGVGVIMLAIIILNIKGKK